MEIKNGVVVVSGGASGLGEATVRHLLARGARAAILDFAQDRGEKLAAELGPDALFCKTDVTDGDSVKAAVAKTMETFGAVHFAVNCAGVAPGAKVLGKEGPLDIARFNQVVQINLIGTMNVIRLAAEQMIKNQPNADGEKGVVINTASIAAFEGQFGQAAYAASKAGVAGMTLPIAREFADYGIRIVTIAPGLFETPMMAGMPPKVYESLVNMTLFPKRLGKPVEFAMLVAQVIENPLLNGETIRLDGGLRMSAR
ncbi:MAG: SDR family NAD(P)-dependent oxidoreductase [Deltaproteobacteria bacterium]|nr:SDR family NAD(P)-dependent oxidoreductase [Deltaproteobacteria bacterium]